MDKLLAMKANITENEKTNILEEMLGYKFDGKIDYSAVDITPVLQSAKREQAKEEMVLYLTQCLKEEYNLEKAEDALLKWEEYKIKHNISIREQVSDE